MPATATVRTPDERALMPSVGWNRVVWSLSENWSDRGDNWTFHAEACGQPYDRWKQSVVERLLRPHLTRDVDVAEIGPGHGRWTEYILGEARTAALIDVSTSCIRACRERFGEREDVSYIVNDGRSLPLDDHSIDLIWSFAGFVHIEPEDIEAYMAEFRRVLRPTGRFLIHHAGWWAAGDRARDPGASRSKMSAERFSAITHAHGLQVERQFRRWGDRLEFGLAFGDLITVGSNPVASDPRVPTSAPRPKVAVGQPAIPRALRGGRRPPTSSHVSSPATSAP